MTEPSNEDWKWRQHNGMLVSPSNMRTSHLYFTLRMIYNHMFPNRAISEFRRYRFRKEDYPPSYIYDAITNIGFELFSRDDAPQQLVKPIGELAAKYHEMLEVKRPVI